MSHGSDLLGAEEGGLHPTLIQQVGGLLTQHGHALVGALAELSCSGHIANSS